MGDKEVILNINRRRFKCKKCRKTFNVRAASRREELDFVGARRKHTHRYAENIIKQLIHSDVSNVAKNNGLSEEEVYSMLEDIVKILLPINVSNLVRVCLDEISLVCMSRKIYCRACRYRYGKTNRVG